MTDNYTMQSLRSILGRWWSDAATATVVPHPSSGLSGALIWRVTYQGKSYCLRRWPREYPSAEDLAAIHGLLRHVAQQGVDFVPTPLGYATFDGHLWELASWMPGEAYDRTQQNQEQRLEAMRGLARFHLAARSFGVASSGAAPGLVARRNLLRKLHEGGLARFRQAIVAKPAGGWDVELRTMLKDTERNVPVVLKKLEASADALVPMQWCIRDVKHDHVLFIGARLVGLIDFGAAAIDSVAGDIARLVGSIIGDERSEWLPAIEAYHGVRPLSPDERRAIELFDQGGTVAASANWLRWLLVEQRQFSNPDAVTGQLRWLHSRLQALE